MHLSACIQDGCQGDSVVAKIGWVGDKDAAARHVRMQLDAKLVFAGIKAFQAIGMAQQSVPYLDRREASDERTMFRVQRRKDGQKAVVSALRGDERCDRGAAGGQRCDGEMRICRTGEVPLDIVDADELTFVAGKLLDVFGGAIAAAEIVDQESLGIIACRELRDVVASHGPSEP